MSEPVSGASARAQLRVEAVDLADALGVEAGDTFPPVFATSRMIALMEIASSRVLLPFLKPGELSVGVTVDVSHTGDSPGALVTATARYVGREGKLFVFEVAASDPALGRSAAGPTAPSSRGEAGCGSAAAGRQLVRGSRRAQSGRASRRPRPEEVVAADQGRISQLRAGLPLTARR